VGLLLDGFSEALSEQGDLVQHFPPELLQQHVSVLVVVHFWPPKAIPWNIRRRESDMLVIFLFIFKKYTDAW
jgi:hypothetical protein